MRSGEGVAARLVQPVLGVALAVPFLPLFAVHPDGALDLLTLLLVLGAGFRVGAAPAGRRAGAAVGAAAVVALALLAFFWAPAWLALGLGALGLWSLVLHLRAPSPRPLLPFGFAWSLAAALLVLWLAP